MDAVTDQSVQIPTKRKWTNRKKQVLQFLQKHGPVSPYVLRAFMNPPMDNNPMDRVLKTLRENRFVVRRKNAHLKICISRFILM